ncbi:aspartyl-phosphate phosphatase Spo0E family protein [Sporosarcina gallistercoris]|uniref:Spo0E family sporulation regulatory protein-aspartic acid phosphatase n=1 Tax=Sporosarcina gallistercoris TaxID=2762245 RepID=UPI003D2CCC97
MDNLEYKIEHIRKELLKTAEERGMSSNETVKLSVELDHLLNIYAYDETGSEIEKDYFEKTVEIKNKKFG